MLDTSRTDGYEGFFEGTLGVVGAEGVERFEVPLLWQRASIEGLFSFFCIDL